MSEHHVIVMIKYFDLTTFSILLWSDSPILTKFFGTCCAIFYKLVKLFFASVLVMTTYSSTRGGVSELNFIDAVISGLADDGGLLVPDSIPIISQEEQIEWRCIYIYLCRYYL